jgi:hypothetical protein
MTPDSKLSAADRRNTSRQEWIGAARVDMAAT